MRCADMEEEQLRNTCEGGIMFRLQAEHEGLKEAVESAL
jgi:hypothetical protein